MDSITYTWMGQLCMVGAVIWVGFTFVAFAGHVLTRLREIWLGD
jgi:hypothetical protein